MGANTSSSGGFPITTTSIAASGAHSSASSSSMLLAAPSTASNSAFSAVLGGGGGGGGGSNCSSSSTGGVSHAQSQYREQRRKRVTGFATLKRKFIRRRRSSKACDHARVLREFVSDWTPLELAALCEEYEALSALRDLSVQAELARPPATTHKQDLGAMYDMKISTDCDLVFRGSVFPVHRAILSARCSYFRELLAGCPAYGARICLELPTTPIDVQMFSALLRYLYTGDFCPHGSGINQDFVKQLGQEFGTLNALDRDLAYLLDSGHYADAMLVFAADAGSDCQRPDSGSSEYGFQLKVEYPCHKAVLSARSPFFRNLIARRTRNVDEYSDRSLHGPTRIVLDETVIPKRYVHVLLHAIYLDIVDLSYILRGSGLGSSSTSLGEVTALTNTGRARPTVIEEAMELYQIGRFLELDILAQGCEDTILEFLSLDTLPTVLKWGCQPHGSAWVFRQACQYLREEFAAVSASPVLHQLDKSQLIHVLQSNFLQASELEVLQAVLKWGEQELIRRMEDREPNLLSHTAHSVSRKGVKKRDLSDVELREILSELLPLVRMDHVLPPNSDVLTQAIRRGLVSTPPSHMIGDERENLRVNAWIRGGKNQGLFVRPRLFMPYFEEVKTLLKDRMVFPPHPYHHHYQQPSQPEVTRLRRSRHMPDIPDTLYMVSSMNTNPTNSTAESRLVRGAPTDDTDDMLLCAASIPTPDPQTLAAILKREHKLRLSPTCQRALGLPLSSQHEIDRQIRLRVVREFNLPDAVSELLENAFLSNATATKDECGVIAITTQTDDCLLEDEDQSPPPSPAATNSTMALHAAAIPSSFLSTSSMCGSSGASSTCNVDGIQSSYGNRNLTFPRHNASGLLGFAASGSSVAGLQANYTRLSASIHHRRDLPALITEGDYRFPHGGALGGLDMRAEGRARDIDNATGHLSDMMPDVAMATASLGQLHLVNASNNRSNSSSSDIPDSLQLDLGDGSSHMLRASGGAINLRSIHHQLPSSSYHHFIQRSNSPFDMLRQGQHSPAQHPPPGTYNTGPPRFL